MASAGSTCFRCSSSLITEDARRLPKRAGGASLGPGCANTSHFPPPTSPPRFPPDRPILPSATGPRPRRPPARIPTRGPTNPNPQSRGADAVKSAYRPAPVCLGPPEACPTRTTHAIAIAVRRIAILILGGSGGRSLQRLQHTFPLNEGGSPQTPQSPPSDTSSRSCRRHPFRSAARCSRVLRPGLLRSSLCESGVISTS
mmetsp:Transcript_14289/g.33024  ORF Transcript_14289/g.33024 Transcript_14289/m.33024 type:complete len:200 (+) Transcript_14289:1642-2241(+)